MDFFGKKIKMTQKRNSKLLEELLNVHTLSNFHKIASDNHLVPPQPRFMRVVMDISNKCNLRCRMCYFSLDKYLKAKPTYILPETFSNMARDLFPHAASLTLSCGNEPLTSPYFIDILKIAAKYKIPSLDFATSGILLDKKSADAVIENGVTDVMFSVDSPKKETYEYIRRGASFDRLVGNIEYLVKRKKQCKSVTPRLRFNVTLMKSNIQDIEDLVVFAAEVGVSELDFRHLVVYEGLGMEGESLVNYKELANYWLDRARKKAKKLGLSIVVCPENFLTGGDKRKNVIQRIVSPKIWRLISKTRRDPKYAIKAGYSRLVNLLGIRNIPLLYCYLPFSYVLINAGGGVYPCPHCHSEPPYGILTPDVSFEQIWCGNSYRAIRRKILSEDPPEMCKKCPALGLAHPENTDFFEPREN